MTDTEKILNLLEINENVPAIVTDNDRKIISSNHAWSNIFGQAEIGKNFNKLFDKNTGLLVKNSFIDAKAFEKIQKRNVVFSSGSTSGDYSLLISPFKIDSYVYMYILLIPETTTSDLFLYPTLDDNGISSNYTDLISNLNKSLPTSLIEKKNLQFSIDNISQPIAIKDKFQYLYTNVTFNKHYNIDGYEATHLSPERLYSEELLSTIKLAENEIFLTKCTFVVEKNDLSIKQNDRIILLPLNKGNGIVESLMLVGNINKNTVVNNDKTIEEETTEVHLENEEPDILASDVAKIIYDKNNFDILNANSAAANLYGYNLDSLKRMNITKLFHPEDMQKLLLPANENDKFIFKHIKNDGSSIDVSISRENITYLDKEAYIDTIEINHHEEEVIKLEEFAERNVPAKEEVSIETQIALPKQADLPKQEKPQVEEEQESNSDFLSSLFHELLTPVNVILGFVQEIIDSVEEPTEEQEESAQIIKDNQQILLQTMNTAVQFAQLDGNKISLNIDQFDVNKYLVDLQDSFSRTSDKENVKVIFDELPDTLSIQHDRSKLLAAISYFVRFIIKLTKSSNVYVSFKSIGDEFYVLAKDSESEISENVSADMIEMFNSELLNDKKNYGISPITLRLAKKLNELLSIRVVEYFDANGENSIAFVTTSALKDKPVEKITTIEKESSQPVKEIEVIKEQEIAKEKIVESISEISIPEEIIEEIPDVITEEIANGEVDEKIVEDIEEEEEIVTEEIATVEPIIDEPTISTISNPITEDLPALSNHSCLFIDDNLDTQLLFKSQMKDFKLLKVCSNLTDAIPLFTKYNFDLIVVDVNLNDTYNGFDALKIIRQFNNYENTPIVAVTAYSFEGDKDKFINFGFTDYFVKPLLREQLLTSLEAILA